MEYQLLRQCQCLPIQRTVVNRMEYASFRQVPDHSETGVTHPPLYMGLLLVQDQDPVGGMETFSMLLIRAGAVLIEGHAFRKMDQLFDSKEKDAARP